MNVGSFLQPIRARLSQSRGQADAAHEVLQRHPTLYVVYACWFAAATTLGEVAYWTYAKMIARYHVLGFHYLWRIPIGNAVLFSVFGLLFLAAGLVVRARPRPRRLLQPLVLACAFVLCAAWIDIAFKSLYYWSVLVLSAGIGLQMSRVVDAHAAAFAWLVRRTIAVLLVLVSMPAAAGFVWPIVVERQALARLAPAPAGAPNVLVIVLDTVRAKSLGAYGYARATTPNLDRIASRGLVFDRAFATAPWTLPSHGSLFTGRLPHEMSGGYATPIDGTHTMLAEVVARHGYVTGGFTANPIYTSTEYGLARGFLHYEDSETTLATSLLATQFGNGALAASGWRDRLDFEWTPGRKVAEQVTDDFLAWQTSVPAGRPFFAFLNYFDAHDPYKAPEEFTRPFRATRPLGALEHRKLESYTPADVQELNDAYDGTIGYLDHHVGRLIAGLEQRGALQNTVVVITADHGEQFGEHRLLGHVNSLYSQLLHIPLVILYPQVPAGRNAGFVSIRDIPATVMQLAGIVDDFKFPGQSVLGRTSGTDGRAVSDILLAEVERTPDDFPAWYPAKKGRMRSVIVDGLHYIKNYGDGREELYDLMNDPEELNDLAPADPARLNLYRSYLDQAMKASPRTNQAR